MILRIFEGRVAATHAAEVHEAIRSTGLPELEQADGCISATFARTFDDDAEVILVVSVWKDWDSIAKWTKGNPERPVFYQGKTELMAARGH